VSSKLPPQAAKQDWWVQSPAVPPKPATFNWWAIVAAASFAFALVVSVLAWVVTHPHQPPHAGQPEPGLAIVTPEPEPHPAPLQPVAEPATPPRPVRVTRATPALHRSEQPDDLLETLPLLEELPALLPPPPLASEPPSSPAPSPSASPPPSPTQPEPKRVAEEPAAPRTPPAPAGETYGTQVLFLNNPAVATDRARQEKKLLFVLHISGNFEDSCFT
jgi:hypothetical protein